MSQRSSTKGHLMSPGGSSAQAGPGAESTRRQVYQWGDDHTQRMDECSGEQIASQQAVQNASVLDQTTAAFQTQVLASSNDAISNKLSETERQKSTAEQALAEAIAEYEALYAAAEKTKAAIESKSAPIDAAHQWMATRGERPVTEKLRDGVEISLNALLAALNESVALLSSTYQAQQTELGRLSIAISAIQADIADKEAALQIDSDTHNLTQPTATSPAPMLGTIKPPYDPQQWRGSTAKLNSNARAIIAVSKRLIIKAGAIEDQAAQKESDAHAELLSQHSASIGRLEAVVQDNNEKIIACEQEFNSLSTQSSDLMGASALKDESAAVATSRLDLRTNRPARERVYDGAQVALQHELATMTAASRDLQASATRCDAVAARVQAVQSKTQADLAAKQHFLDLELMCQSIAIL